MGLLPELDDRQLHIDSEANGYGYRPYEYQTENNSSWAAVLFPRPICSLFSASPRRRARL